MRLWRKCSCLCRCRKGYSLSIAPCCFLGGVNIHLSTKSTNTLADRPMGSLRDSDWSMVAQKVAKKSELNCNWLQCREAPFFLQPSINLDFWGLWSQNFVLYVEQTSSIITAWAVGAAGQSWKWKIPSSSSFPVLLPVFLYPPIPAWKLKVVKIPEETTADAQSHVEWNILPRNRCERYHSEN